MDMGIQTYDIMQDTFAPTAAAIRSKRKNQLPAATGYTPRRVDGHWYLVRDVQVPGTHGVHTVTHYLLPYRVTY